MIPQEGVPVVTNTNSCQRIPKQVQEKIQKNDIYYDNQVVTSFDEYYQLLWLCKLFTMMAMKMTM